VIEEENLLAQVNLRGQQLRDALTDAFGQHPNVGDIRGRGLFQGIELVQNKETKAVFDPSLKVNAKVKAAAMAGGLMCYPMGGTIDGQQGDHVMFAPPFIISEAQIEEIVTKFGAALESALPQ
jgi:hypothetical protein